MDSNHDKATSGYLASAGTGRVTGSMDINMPTQLTVYASTAIQRLRVLQPSIFGHFEGQDMDVNSAIESYTINGAPQESGLNVIIDHNVDSVRSLGTFSRVTRGGPAVTPKSTQNFSFKS